MQRFLLLFWMGCLVCWRGLALDPVEELKSFSAFDKVDLQKLADGEIMVERGPFMDFPRGISAQACFVVMAPAEKTAKLYRTWDASHHESLKLHSHCHIQSPPSDENFKPLNLSSQKSPFRWLLDKTQATTSERSDLHLSIAEATQISESMKKGGESAEATARCWKDILKARALKFQKEGLAGSPPYEMGGSVITSSSEIQNLLKEIPKISAQFSPFLPETLLAKQPLLSAPPPYCYWELLEINSHAAVNLGAVYLKALDDGRYQILDCDYYSNGGIYASFTLRQIWPIKIRDKDASLIWRGEFVSAPTLAIVRGIERMAAGGIMIQEIKKAIRAFQEDAPKTP